MVTARFDMIFGANTTQAKASIMSLQSTLMTMSATASTGISAMTAVGKASIAVFLGVTAAAAGAVAIMADYNRGLQQAAALGELTAAQTEALGTQISALTIKYGQQATAMAEGVKILTKAGLTQEEITMSMESITQLMLANGLAFEQAANIAVYAVKQFGGDEGFGALPEILDKVQKATQESILDVEDMQQALQYAGTTAVLANIPLEVLLASMATLSQRGMEAGVASRSLNQAFLSMIEHTDLLQQSLNEFGIQVQVIKDGTINIHGIVQAYKDASLGLEELIAFNDIFTKRGLRSWGALLQGAEEYSSIYEMIGDSTGTLEQVTTDMMNTISYQWARLKAILMQPFLQPEMIDKAQELMERLEEPLTNISVLLYEKLMVFFDWTINNVDSISTFFSTILDYVIKIVDPLYNMGRLIFEMPEGLLKLIIAFKIFKSLGLISMWQQLTKNMYNSWVQHRLYKIELQQLQHQQQQLANGMGNMRMQLSAAEMAFKSQAVAVRENEQALMMLTLLERTETNAQQVSTVAKTTGTVASRQSAYAQDIETFSKMKGTNQEKLLALGIYMATLRKNMDAAASKRAALAQEQYNLSMVSGTKSANNLAMGMMNVATAGVAAGMSMYSAYAMGQAMGPEDSASKWSSVAGTAMSGMMLGAAIGTMVTPGVGTLIGGGAGLLLGGAVGYGLYGSGAKKYKPLDEEIDSSGFASELEMLRRDMNRNSGTYSSGGQSEYQELDSGGLVPKDMLAIVHEGEEVLTKEQRQRGIGENISIHIHGNVYGVDNLYDEIEKVRNKRMRGVI